MKQEFDIKTNTFVEVPEKDPITDPKTGNLVYPDNQPYYNWLETGAAMLEAAKGFRRLKAHKQLPILRAALATHQASHHINPDLEQKAKAA